jgi:hypothetical protein
MKRRRFIIVGISLLLVYFGSYAWFYAGRVPAGNLAYFCYLRGGDATEKAEWTLYYLYYPAYKMHRLFGAGRHDFDRGITTHDGLYDGDEPNKR